MNRCYTTGLPVRLYEAESSVASVAAAHGLPAGDVLDFSLNVNPYGPPPAAVAAAAAALGCAHHYPDLHLDALRTAVAMRHGVAPDALYFGAGLDDVIKLVLHAWTSAGDAVLVHLPTFPRYELEAALHGCEVVAVVNDPPWTIDLRGVEAALAARAIALAFLCSPNNPTGERIDGAAVAGLARRFPGTVFVVDEALLDPLEDGVLPQVRGAPNVAVLRTFSKAYGLAGFRVGYAVAPAPLVAVAERGRPPFNVALPSAAAALAALGDEAFLRACRARFCTESDHVAARLRQLPALVLRGRHANMLLVETPGRRVAALQEALGARGIVVADAACFGGLDGHAAFRVSLRDRASNERLLAALEDVA